MQVNTDHLVLILLHFSHNHDILLVSSLSFFESVCTRKPEGVDALYVSYSRQQHESTLEADSRNTRSEAVSDSL